MTHEPGKPENDQAFVYLLNEDLALAFRSLVQTLSNLGGARDDEYASIRKERIEYLDQQLQHALTLVRQVQALGGMPTTHVPPVHASSSAESAITEELALEHLRLIRYRKRIEEARALGITDTADALEKLAADTQQQVDKLVEVLHR